MRHAAHRNVSYKKTIITVITLFSLSSWSRSGRIISPPAITRIGVWENPPTGLFLCHPNHLLSHSGTTTPTLFSASCLIPRVTLHPIPLPSHLCTDRGGQQTCSCMHSFMHSFIHAFMRSLIPSAPSSSPVPAVAGPEDAAVTSAVPASGVPA